MDFVVTAAVDWKVEREKIDLAAIATRLLGPAPKREGSRLLWLCPFHDDHSPSLVVVPGKKRWKCYPCGIGGDAVDLVMRVERLTFPEAIAWIMGTALPSRATTSGPVQADPVPKFEPQPAGWSDWALPIVEEAELLLWEPEGEKWLDYLLSRDLTRYTVRQAHVGLILDGRSGVPAGITIPWFDGGRLTLVNVRRPAGSNPKYMVFKGSRRGGIYPGAKAIRAGLPLVIVEGELDCLLLGQELDGLAAVVTLGGASSRPDHRTLGPMLAASRPWLIATDADTAGDKAAEAWPASTQRVRPPAPYKDWTDAALGGVNLRRWWQEILNGIKEPQLFTWEELSAWRWGPAIEDPTPGIVV